MATKPASTWPVNELGEILLTQGAGSGTIAGQLPLSMVPVDPATGNVKAVLSLTVPKLQAGSGIPRILPPSSTLGNNGTVTFGTALPSLPAADYPLDTFVYFPGFTGTATFSGTTMLVSAGGVGNLVVGSVIQAVGVPAGTKITALGTGIGQAGTYTISNNVGTIGAAIAVATSVLGYAADGSVPSDGLYYTRLTTNTAGIAYNNRYDPTTGLDPAIPVAPSAFVLTGGGAFTQIVNMQVSLAGYKLAGGTLGNNGSLVIKILRAWFNSANNKNIQIFVFNATTNNSLMSSNDTTSAGMVSSHTWWNLGAQNKNIMVGAGLGDGNASSGQNYQNVDTSNDVLFLVKYTLANAAEWAIINAMQATTQSF